MSRTLLLFLLVFQSFHVFSQDKLLGILPLENGKVTYSGVIDVDGVPKDELYRRARIWLVDAYRSSKDVLQFEDKENGTLIGKGYLPTSWQANFMYTFSVNLQHTIRLDFKDGKYKYSITDFIMDYYITPSKYSSGGNQRLGVEELAKNRGEKNARKYYESVNPKVSETLTALENAMKTKTKDW